MTSTAALNQDIMSWMETLPAALDAAHLDRVDAMVKQFDPARHQGALAELLWDAVSGYRSSDSVSYIQLARRIVAHGLLPEHMTRNNRCAYHDLYQVLVLPPESLTAAGISELFGLYGDIIATEHAIKGDPRGGYGAVHFLAMLHKEHPAYAIDMLGRAIASGFSIDHTDAVRETPLLALVSRSDYPSRTDVIRMMLGAGANPMITSSGGRNCWVAATTAEHPFFLMDLFAAHTPHARQHGSLGPGEMEDITAMALKEDGGKEIHLLSSWLQARVLRNGTSSQDSPAGRPGPRL